ncbi:MAG: sulfatase-like hydrolase/transferase [Akkermansiaceae bacterium]|nr:sulfatase-like hydrolase/transferase [Akkermansiaceae bacterium]
MKHLIATLLAACLAAPFASAAAPKPNFVVVFIDDMGWGDFSCFGNKEAETPNIDRFASEGIRFKSFYVNAPICSPSRCALTTGQYPQRWRITSFLNNRKDNKRRGMVQWLDPAAPTLAKSLKQQGYTCGHFGKWHLGGQRDVDEAPPITDYGYDKSLTNFEGMGPKLLPLVRTPQKKKPFKIWEDAERLGGPYTWMPRCEITTGFIDPAIGFMDQAVKDKKPFYVNLWPDDVHSPFFPSLKHWAGNKKGLYHAVLREMDVQFGRLFDHIRNSPELRGNTVVLVCSDNGPEPGAGSAGPFRGTKGMLFEGGIRSPLIAWAPGMMDASMAGSANESAVFAAFDIAPSLLALAGAQPSEELDGEDLSATLLGKSGTGRTKPIFWRRPPDRDSSGPARELPDLAVRDGEWKLLCEYDGSDPELYHLTKDPGETKNLADSRKAEVERLTRLAVGWHRSMPPDKGPALAVPPKP